MDEELFVCQTGGTFILLLGLLYEIFPETNNINKVNSSVL